MKSSVLDLIKNGARVGFFGIGRSNLSLINCLPLGKCSLTLRSDVKIDRSAIPSGVLVERIFEGERSCLDINEDVLIFSPSVRRDRKELREAEMCGVIFTSDAELFFEENERPLFAVTGSDGKSTTAKLTELILQEGGVNAKPIGNMGEPMVNSLSSNAEVFVAELSSFMLTYATPYARRGAITNLTPNHLDWHNDFEEYKKTKISLLKHSEEFVISDRFSDIKGAYGIVGCDKGFNELKKEYSANIYITLEEGYIRKNGENIINTDSIKRSEKHNIRNLMTAIALTDGCTDEEAICRVAKNFKGLPHRCELFLSDSGVDYFDSSIDTSPARTMQTLSSLGRQCVIILGGKDKGLEYNQLSTMLKRYSPLAIICGENRFQIYNAIKEDVKTEVVEMLEDAVRVGITEAKRVGALLLSPASASYDCFKNYEERGEKFKEYIYKNTAKKKIIVYIK